MLTILILSFIGLFLLMLPIALVRAVYFKSKGMEDPHLTKTRAAKEQKRTAKLAKKIERTRAAEAMISPNPTQFKFKVKTEPNLSGKYEVVNVAQSNAFVAEFEKVTDALELCNSLNDLHREKVS